MPKDTLRILYITTFYPTKLRPHHGIFFKDHAEALAQKHDVAVLFCSIQSLKEKLSNSGKSEFFIENDVFTQFEFGTSLSHRFAKTNQTKLKKICLLGFDKLVKNWGKPDLIIAQCSLPAGELAMEIKLKWGIPFIVIEHFSFLSKQIENEKSKMDMIYSNASKIASVNKDLKTLINQTFKCDSELISNVISSDFTLKPNLESDQIKWLYVGYDDLKKGVDLLENALKAKPNMNITLVGDGLSRLVSKKHPNVSHIESATREEMILLMQTHQALLSTSRIETFGMAIVEALASGLPVVATKSGGPDSYLSPEMGILCDLEVDSVCEAIDYIESNYSSYNSVQIRNAILSKFGTQNYINQIEALISPFNESR